MRKILLIAYLLLGENISANLLQEGSSAYEKGDLDNAINIWTKACNKGEIKACDRLGTMYYFGYGIAQDQLKAKELYERVCDARIGEDCAKIAKMYDYGYTLKEDKSKALQFYKKACDNGFEPACNSYYELKRKEP